jgi:general secretion pathway protein D
VKQISVVLLFTLTLFAQTCEPITISTTKSQSTLDIVKSFSQLCHFNLLPLDKKTQKILKRPHTPIYLSEAPLDELFQRLFHDKNLSYHFEQNRLRINYLTTHTYHIDYITTKRHLESQTNVVMSTQQELSQEPTNSIGASITSDESFDLFDRSFAKQLHAILNRPTDPYKTPKAVINTQAGLITVTATYQQHERLKEYLDTLKRKLQTQVMIDLKLYSVELDNDHQVGIDWGAIGSLLNLQATLSGTITQPLLTLNQELTLGSLLSFLAQHGSVKSISNPKLLTLNNQPAIISVGKEIYYKLTQSTTTTSTSTTTQSSQSIQSVFAGVLLDITPSIASDHTIILKINPSISSISEMDQSVDKSMPPDLNKKQISSVIKAHDQETVVLGGLIDKQSYLVEEKVPLLGDIWLLGWLFKSQKQVERSKELVLVITPYLMSDSKGYHTSLMEQMESSEPE